MKTDQLKQMPKVELHCHLDGSLSPGLIRSLLGRNISDSELMVAPECRSLAEYLEKFSLPLSCMKGLGLPGTILSEAVPRKMSVTPKCGLRRSFPGSADCLNVR